MTTSKGFMSIVVATEDEFRKTYFSSSEADKGIEMLLSLGIAFPLTMGASMLEDLTFLGAATYWSGDISRTTKHQRTKYKAFIHVPPDIKDNVLRSFDKLDIDFMVNPAHHDNYNFGQHGSYYARLLSAMGWSYSNNDSDDIMTRRSLQDIHLPGYVTYLIENNASLNVSDRNRANVVLRPLVNSWIRFRGQFGETYLPITTNENYTRDIVEKEGRYMVLALNQVYTEVQASFDDDFIIYAQQKHKGTLYRGTLKLTQKQVQKFPASAPISRITQRR
ncbi:MAG: hypothetical protein ABIJ34_03840 [archaeon]